MVQVEWVALDGRPKDSAIDVLRETVSEIVRGYSVATHIQYSPSQEKLTIGEIIDSPPAPTKVIIIGTRAACDAAHAELEKQRGHIILKVLQA
jgi:hypothetical protein